MGSSITCAQERASFESLHKEHQTLLPRQIRLCKTESLQTYPVSNCEY